MNQSTSRVKRSRKSAPKSRQGCITCKSRHVKCDEARPFCKRCAKAGRTCQGYPQEDDEDAEETTVTTTSEKRSAARASAARPSTSSKSIDTSLVPASSADGNPAFTPAGLPVLLNTSNARELRFLEYFYRRTAPAMSGYFDARFYGRVLLQSGQFEPAVRHGMMAVAAMHEHFEYSLVPSFGQSSSALAKDDKPPFALYQYNKAIAAINEQLSSGPGSIESVLMCCLLFVSLECLRGDTASAVSHLKAGGNIIANWKLRNRKVEAQAGAAYSSIREIPKHTDTPFVNEHLVPIFERLSTHVDGAARIASSEYQDLVNPDINAENPLSEGFADLDEARAAIMNLGSVTTRFIKGIAMSKYTEGLTEDDARVIAGLQCKMAQWEMSMEYLFARSPQQRNTRRATVIQVQHCLFKIVVATGLSTAQCCNDYMTEDWEYLLGKAEKLMGSLDSRLPANGDEEDISVFSLEEGVVPACFYTAVHCRTPDLRRKAVELLHKGPARQGIWNAVLLARVAERVIDLEENFATPTSIESFDLTQFQPSIDPLLDGMADPTLHRMPLTPKSLSIPSDCTTLDTIEQAELTLLSSFSHEVQLPPENARIHHVDVKESIDGTPHKHAVTFYRMPSGLSGDWEVWTEDIHL